MRTWLGLTRAPLAGVLLVACIVGCTNNPSPPPPSPSPSPSPSPTRPPPAFGSVEVTGIGEVEQGGDSGNGLVLQFSESSAAAIGAGAGSLRLVLTDAAGGGDTLSFIGTPSIAAPGSLGASATLSAPNTLTISVADSDPLNLEPMTLTGLGIRAASSAAVGPIGLAVAGCTGSLAGCTAASALTTPGNVVAGP